MRSQKGWGPKVAKAKAVWIGSGETPTISMTAFNWELLDFAVCGRTEVTDSLLLRGADLEKADSVGRVAAEIPPT